MVAIARKQGMYHPVKTKSHVNIATFGAKHKKKVTHHDENHTDSQNK
jgi:hypothetical protein